MSDIRRRERYNIDPLKFCEIFTTVHVQGGTLDDVVARMSELAGKSVPKTAIVGRAANYRAKGVQLPSLER